MNQPASADPGYVLLPMTRATTEALGQVAARMGVSSVSLGNVAIAAFCQMLQLDEDGGTELYRRLLNGS